jgi:hypothetical protein
LATKEKEMQSKVYFNSEARRLSRNEILAMKMKTPCDETISFFGFNFILRRSLILNHSILYPTPRPKKSVVPETLPILFLVPKRDRKLLAKITMQFPLLLFNFCF